eukprot:5276564-Pleurochrysis_carterae.AAC.3
MRAHAHERTIERKRPHLSTPAPHEGEHDAARAALAFARTPLHAKKGGRVGDSITARLRHLAVHIDEAGNISHHLPRQSPAASNASSDAVDARAVSTAARI